MTGLITVVSKVMTLKAQQGQSKVSVKSLFAVTALAAVACWITVVFGVMGIGMLGGLSFLVVINLGVAFIGLTRGCPFTAGILGGALLWSLGAIAFAILDPGVFRWVHSTSGAMLGLLTGSICGGFVRLTQERATGTSAAKGLAFCMFLLIAFAIAILGGRLIAAYKVRQPGFVSIVVYRDDTDYVLEFWGNGIGNAFVRRSLESVARDEKLSIYFLYTNVTDDGFKVLAEFPNTVNVDLRGTRATKSGVQWLRNRLPMCNITPPTSSSSNRRR